MDFELRRQRRMAMRGVPERLGLQFARGDLEMRARPNGTAAGSAFEFRGYATVYGEWFDMWDQSGEPYQESVAPGACKRTLANPNLDVPFLIGHNDAGIPLARTKSGTMTLSEDSRGLHVLVPSMDGRREEVRALASAVERGDMDEMSLAFVCLTPSEQQWDADYEHRTIREMDLHRGDVCAVTHGANPATAGAWMGAVEQLSFRRPAAIGGPVLLGRERRAAMHPPLHGTHSHEGPNGEAAREHSHDHDASHRGVFDPDHDGDDDATAAGDTDHDYVLPDGEPGPKAARASARLLEVLSSVPQAERDRAKAAGNSLPDGSYPVNNVAQLHSAAVLAASHHGDWKAAQALIRRRAKELGVDVNTLPGFGEEKAAPLPLEHRASAADDSRLAGASDYDAEAADHPVMLVHAHAHAHPDGSVGTERHSHPLMPVDHGAGHSAMVTVDDATGIPGGEVQFSASWRHELRVRALELESLAAHRVPLGTSGAI